MNMYVPTDWRTEVTVQMNQPAKTFSLEMSRKRGILEGSKMGLNCLKGLPQFFLILCKITDS